MLKYHRGYLQCLYMIDENERDHRASAVPDGTTISHPSISLPNITWQPRRDLEQRRGFIQKI